MDSLPLSEPVLLILLSLAKPGPGFIQTDVYNMSNGRVSLDFGTVIDTLRGLLDYGWIEPLEMDDLSYDRQGYRLTADGRRYLQMEISRMRRLVRIGSLRVRRKNVQSPAPV